MLFDGNPIVSLPQTGLSFQHLLVSPLTAMISNVTHTLYCLQPSTLQLSLHSQGDTMGSAREWMTVVCTFLRKGMYTQAKWSDLQCYQPYVHNMMWGRSRICSTSQALSCKTARLIRMLILLIKLHLSVKYIMP